MNDRELIEAYKHDLQQYTREQLSYISEEGVWSLGQMYSHIIIVAHEYIDSADLCAEAKEEQQLGKTPFGEHLYELGGFPPEKIKLSDDPGNTPENTDSREELTQGLDRLLERMKEWEGKMDGVNPNSKAAHAGFGWLNAREWLELVGMHSRHHLRQKSELEQRLGC